VRSAIAAKAKEAWSIVRSTKPPLRRGIIGSRRTRMPSIASSDGRPALYPARTTPSG
jgi:hypothetical protein